VDEAQALQKKLKNVDNIFTLLSDMRRRSAVSELDKVSGLVQFLCRGSSWNSIPLYQYGEDVDTLWGRIIGSDAIRRWKQDLFWLYPFPANAYEGGPSLPPWLPSWRQLMKNLPAINVQGVFTESGEDLLHAEAAWDSYDGPHVEECLVTGFGVSDVSKDDHPGKIARRGNIAITKDGVDHRFEIEAHHFYLIPDGRYQLVGCGSCHYWALGTVTDGSFNKISVLRMGKEERERLQRLELAPTAHVNLRRVVRSD